MRAGLVGFFLALATTAGCHEEPTIVITFAPQDLGPRRDAGRPIDPVPDKAAVRVDAAAPSVRVEAATGGACKRDRDCVLVSNCCDCANGGGRLGLSSERARATAKERSARCKDILCATMVSTDPSCASGARAACIRGQCGVTTERRP